MPAMNRSWVRPCHCSVRQAGTEKAAAAAIWAKRCPEGMTEAWRPFFFSRIRSRIRAASVRSPAVRISSDDPDRLVHVPVEGLDGEEHLLPVSRSVGGQARGEVGPEAAGPERDPLCHRLVGEAGRPHLDGELAQERQIGLQLLGDVGDVEGQIEIGDPVGEEVVAQDRNAADGRPLRGDRFDLAGDVADLASFGRVATASGGSGSV